MLLNLSVSIKNGKIFTELHTKSTDCHLYLHCSSSHPEHKKSFVYSRILINICSHQKDFNIHSSGMKSSFLNKAYSKYMINLEMEKVRFGQSKNNTNKQGTGVPFVMTYHPKSKLVGQLMKILQQLLYQNEVVKKVFIPQPIVFYGFARKILAT